MAATGLCFFVLLVSAMNEAYARLLALEKKRARLSAELEQRTDTGSDELAWARSGCGRDQGAAGRRRAAQLQRLDAIGYLTGGISHDCSNMLGVVIGDLDLAQPVTGTIPASPVTPPGITGASAKRSKYSS